MQQITSKASWTFSEKAAFRFFCCFLLLFMATFPFVHSILPDTGRLISYPFELFVKWTGTYIFHLQSLHNLHLISDSKALYIHTFNLAILSLLITTIWTVLDKKKIHYKSHLYWLLVAVRYYLAKQLMIYGFNKVFKWQFYLPEPNTLYTNVGDVSRDLLYWTVMGTSESYNRFMGALEVLAALLLLFRRTMVAGAIASFAILLNVVMVNFSFDISVKLYSCFLLFLSIVILTPDAPWLLQLFRKRNPSRPTVYLPSFERPLLYLLVKTFVVSVLLLEALYPYFSSGNFNDDLAARPPLHGAYEVTLFIRNQDTLAPLTTDRFRWKKLFIHRKNYLIVEHMNEEMTDYKLEHTIPVQQLVLRNYDQKVPAAVLNYQQYQDSTMHIKGSIDSAIVEVHLKKINLGKLPLFEKGIHWTVD